MMTVKVRLLAAVRLLLVLPLAARRRRCRLWCFRPGVPRLRQPPHPLHQLLHLPLRLPLVFLLPLPQLK